MRTSIEARWESGAAFTSEVGGHRVRTDAPVAAGGSDSGASPKNLMMVALAGCTGVDVVEILKKMRMAFDGLVITVEAELTDETPSLYSAMHLIYAFTGQQLDPAKLLRAVELSQEKYCGVAMMYRRIMALSWEIRLNGEPIAQR